MGGSEEDSTDIRGGGAAPPSVAAGAGAGAGASGVSGVAKRAGLLLSSKVCGLKHAERVEADKEPFYQYFELFLKVR